MIAIIDYGMGNIGSIANMLKRLGYEAVVTSSLKVLEQAHQYILPGVGSFDKGITNLQKLNIISLLEEQVLHNKKPFLGICLGMQLLAKSSEEGQCDGLGWFDANVVKFNFDDKRYKVPHMGWNLVHPCGNLADSLLYKGINEEQRFYFVHSYHMMVANKEQVTATANYGHIVTASIEKSNIMGVQFHPEKSHKYGMNLLQNFSKLGS